MKLASLKGGRDGRLVVVSDDLAYFAYAGHIATTLQDVLDNWELLAPKLELLATDLNHAVIPRERFHERDAASPLPRAYQRLSADGACLRSDRLGGPRDPVTAGTWAVGEVVVVTGDVAAGPSAAEACAAIRLVGLSNVGGGLSPVLVTPDTLGARWQAGRLQGILNSDINGEAQSRADASATDFSALVASVAREAPLSAGTIIGSGGDPTILRSGDCARIWMDDDKHHPIFGVIEQVVG
jgi:fumarylacetoacetate (FAA) hydrolase